MSNSTETEMTSEVSIDGFAHEDFDRVRSVFEENFAERGEVGAAVAVYVEGEPVVDLWGGYALHDGERDGPWERDTLVTMMSVNKGVIALCAHRLADQGKLDYEQPVAHYWPEFAQAGKGDITVRQLISNLAALVYPDQVPDGKLFDWDAMVEGLAETAPAWEVGSQAAEHTSTYGHLVGELVRRVSGQMPDEYFRKEIADPLGVDYWFVVPAEDRHRVSEVQLQLDSGGDLGLEEESMEKLGRAWRPAPHHDTLVLLNDPQYMHQLSPSGGGKGNARAVGKLYAALSLGGTIDGCTVMSPETLEKATTLQWEGPDGLTGWHLRFAMGLMLNSPPHFPMGPNRDAFGHPGFGGNWGFADPDRHVSFSYCTNLLFTGSGAGDRSEALIDATFASI